MKLTCPACVKSITIPDSEAGKSTRCPLCNADFTAPILPTSPDEETYSVVLPPPPPVAPVPPTPPEKIPEKTPEKVPEPVHSRVEETSVPVGPMPVPSAGGKDLPAGYSGSFSFGFSLAVVQWLPAICLTLALLLTFFKWVGTYPAGYSAYSQNAWQALFAKLSKNPVSEKVMKADAPIREKLYSSWWLLPYLLCLIPAVLLAWGGEIVALANIKFSPGMANLWKLRPLLISGLVTLTLIFFMIQCIVGFGLENALEDMMANDPVNVELLKNAVTPEEIQTAEMTIAAKLGSFHLQSTIWLRLAALAHLVALASIAIEAWLTRRGNKPSPQIGILW